MDNWLKKRLTPAKEKQPRWASLAESVEVLWESFFDPKISRLERLRSSYTADDEDIARKLLEMGDYFTYEAPKKEDRPVTIAWRRLELQHKDVEYIIKSVFKRHFGHFPVYWLPLFAPKDLDYGMLFEPFEGLEDVPEKNVPPEGMFLTSRGVLGVDRSSIYKDGYVTKIEFREKAWPLIRRTKPLHIVFDGFLWFIRFKIQFEASLTVTWETEDHYPLLFAPKEILFDYVPADVMPLDTSTSMIWCQRDITRNIVFPLIYNITAKHKTLRTYHASEMTRGKLGMKNTVSRNIDYPFPAKISATQPTETLLTIPHPCTLPTLDQQPLFDEIPADFMPLDYPYGGYRNA